MQTYSFTKPHKKKSREARKWMLLGRTSTRTTTSSGMLSPHFGCVVVPQHDEKHMVFQ